MAKVYIVIGSTGTYDEVDQWFCGAWRDESAAERYAKSCADALGAVEIRNKWGYRVAPDGWEHPIDKQFRRGECGAWDVHPIEVMD